MTLEDIAIKVIPPLVVIVILAVTGVVLKSYTLEAELSDCKETNKNQWVFITANTQKSIRNEEKLLCKGKK